MHPPAAPVPEVEAAAVVPPPVEDEDFAAASEEGEDVAAAGGLRGRRRAGRRRRRRGRCPHHRAQHGPQRTPREETAAYVAEHYRLADAEALLDDVYAKAGQ